MRYHSDNKTTAGRPASVRTASNALASAQNELNVLDELIADLDKEIIEFDQQLILADLYEDHGKNINLTFEKASRASEQCTELEQKIQELLTEYVQCSGQLMQAPQTINSAWAASFTSLPLKYSLRRFALAGVLETMENEAQEKQDRQALAEEIGSQIRDLTKLSTTLTTEQANKLAHTLGLIKSWRMLINGFQKVSDLLFARISLISETCRRSLRSKRT